MDEAGAGVGSEEGRRRVALASICECVPALPHTFTLMLRRQSGRRAGGRGLMGVDGGGAGTCERVLLPCLSSSSAKSSMVLPYFVERNPHFVKLEMPEDR